MNMQMPGATKRAASKKPEPTTTSTNFADTLRSLMLEQRFSASDLAREVWGTTKDGRGYEVAKNRDRIGHYLSGRSHPGRQNLIKIAKALRVNVDVLQRTQPAPEVREATPTGPRDIQMIVYVDGTVCLTVAKLVVSSKTGQSIIDLISKDPVHSKHHLVPKELVNKAKKKSINV